MARKTTWAYNTRNVSPCRYPALVISLFEKGATLFLCTKEEEKRSVNSRWSTRLKKKKIKKKKNIFRPLEDSLVVCNKRGSNEKKKATTTNRQQETTKNGVEPQNI